MQQNPTIRKIRTSLLEKGLSVKDWTVRNNFNYRDVVKIIHRYAKRQMCPQSPFVYRVLVQLKEDTGVNLMEAKP